MSAIHPAKPVHSIRAAAVVGTVVLGLVLTGGQLQAAATTAGRSGESPLDGAMAGQGAIRWFAILADDRPDVFARARAERDALRFPIGSSRVGRHVHDGVRGSDYDEVSELDSAGQTIALTQVAADGRLAAAVRFDAPAATLRALGGDEATKVARRALTDAGIPPTGRVRILGDDISGGWELHWDRVQSGIRVRGDEVRARVWRDGQIQSVARVEHELAPEPAQRLTSAAAYGAVTGQLDAWFGSRGSECRIQSMDLEWVGPNGAFDPAKLAATAAPYRLAWVANVEPSGPVSDSVRLITLYVDAGDGSVIGGDVVE